MTEDPTTSSTDDMMMDVEEAAAAKSTVTAERRKTEDADTAVDDDIADSVGAAVKEISSSTAQAVVEDKKGMTAIVGTETIITQRMAPPLQPRPPLL